MRWLRNDEIHLTLRLEVSSLPDEVDEIFTLERIIRRQLTRIFRESFAHDWLLSGEKSSELFGMRFSIDWSVPSRRLSHLARFRELVHQACDRVSGLTCRDGEVHLTSSPDHPHRIAA